MSMIKVISPGSQDFSEPVASLIKISSRGLLGQDKADLVKRAGAEFADKLTRIKFAKDEIPVHMIAIGATEDYGPNRNADGFTRDCCKNYHHTFEKYARFYRDHANKNPAKSYGIVKASAYHEPMKRIELIVALNGSKEAADRNGGLIADKEMEKLANGDDIGVSMACALPGTLVKVRRGFKAVEDIEPGDEVLTKYGRYRRVYATMTRIKQHTARIGTKYYGRQVLEFTPDHRFWVARWDDIPAPAARNSLRSKDPTGYSEAFRRKYRNDLHKHARYVPCGELKYGDLLLMPIDRGDGSSALTKDEARLLGYYLAEGSITGSGYLTFTCGVNDDLPREMPQLVSASVRQYAHSASVAALNVAVHDRALAASVAEKVGRGVRQKCIPREVIDATDDVKLEFIAAWFNGDGWQDSKGLHWSTCSRTLSLELQNLLAAVGIPASVYRIDHTSDLPDRLRTGDGTEYTVNVSNRYSSLFAARCKAEHIATKATKTTAFITGNYLAVPVTGVKIVEEEREVYDIAVEEDESFTAFGLAVSNCKIPFDVCSGCGNKARTRAEYCDSVDNGGMCKAGGLKHNLGRVLNDGHILHADNPNPTFFDISHVFRPADRIAYIFGKVAELQKAASAGCISGAEMAEQMGVTAPIGFDINGDISQTVASQLVALEKLAAAEATNGLGTEFAARSLTQAALAAAPCVQPHVDFSACDGVKLAEVLRGLADANVVLPLRDFLALTVKSASDALVQSVSAALPGVFGALYGEPDIVTALENNPYSLAPSAAPKTRLWAEKVASTHSILPREVEKRAYTAAIRNVTPAATPTVKQAGSGAATALARHYALYKIASFSVLNEKNPNCWLTANQCVLQNYVT